MEDTLRACKAVRLVLCEVLILVVMEDTLRVSRAIPISNSYYVLILVLMEDSLRGETAELV